MQNKKRDTEPTLQKLQKNDDKQFALAQFISNSFYTF